MCIGKKKSFTNNTDKSLWGDQANDVKIVIKSMNILCFFSLLLQIALLILMY